MSEPKKVGRRTFLNYATAVVATGVIVGAATYLATPKGATTTVTAPAATTTVTVPGTTITTEKTVTTTSVREQEKVTITFWTWGEMAMAFKALKSDFEARYPNINVELVELDLTSLYQKLLTAFATGTGAPDLATPLLRNFYEFKDGLVEVTDNVTPLKDYYNEFTWNCVGSEGKIYGYPGSWGPMVMYYRKDIFEQNGIDIEKEIVTWDDFINVGKKITKPPDRYMTVICNTSYGTNLFAGFLNSRGGNIFNEAGKVISPNSLAKETFKWYIELATKHKIAYAEKYLTEPFWAGLKANKAATWFLHAQIPALMAQYLPEQKGLWKAKAWPLWDRNAPAVTGVWGGWFFAIPKQSKYPNQARTLAEYMLFTLFGIKKLIEVGSIFPPIRIFIPGAQVNPQPYLDQYHWKEVRPAPLFRYGFTWSKVETIIGNAIDLSLAGSKTPEEAWDAAEKELVEAFGKA